MTKASSYFRVVVYTILGLIFGLYLMFAIGLGLINLLVQPKENTEPAIFSRSEEPHQIQVLDSGLQSLHERLKLIRNAKKSIDLEFFIYEVDEASRILNHELVRKANQGVKVRILVDFSAPIFKFKPVFASFLKIHGIEVRYYNTSPLYRVVSSQHRSHRKLLIVDGEAVVLGGRNIGNDYFDLSPHYNFLDTDIVLSGPLVQNVQDSFDLYWNSDFSEDSQALISELSGEELKSAQDFFLRKDSDTALVQEVEKLVSERAGQSVSHTCLDTTFVTDYPSHGEENRKVYLAIVDVVKEAKKEIWAESPYFVLKSEGLKLLRGLGDRGVHLQVLTNSLNSTDAAYAVSALFPSLGALGDARLSLYGFRGHSVEGQSSDRFSETKRWGVHSKRAVIDGRTVLVGTYNIDPRSANLNSELMVVCRGNEALAQEMLKSLQARVQASAPIIEKGQVTGRWNLLEGASFGQKMKMFLYIPVASLFDFLL